MVIASHETDMLEMIWIRNILDQGQKGRSDF